MNRKALIIDDHLPSRVRLARALHEGGYEIVGEIEDAKSAIRLVSILSPDVILMSVRLPDMDGVSAASKIIETRPLPIVLVTSHFEKGTVERAQAAGIMAYLVKPLRKEEILPSVELAISRFTELDSLRKDNENLKKTLESRKLIERAKGILMKNQGLSEADAFCLLRKKSMSSHRPMVEIARAIILSEEMKPA